MKLSNGTLSVLKNFVTIYERLSFVSGKVQRTASLDEDLLVEAELDDFPRAFAVYDLSHFISNLSALNDPELEFKDTHVILRDKNISVNYYYCSPNLVTPAMTGELDITPSFTFDLAEDMLSKINRISQLNSLTDLKLIAKGGKLSVNLFEDGNDSANEANATLDENYSGPEGEVGFPIANLKLIPGDYTVDVDLAGFARFRNKSRTLTYYLALKKDDE